jgi:peptide deformylase
LKWAVGKPPPEEKYPPEGGGFKPKKMENKTTTTLPIVAYGSTILREVCIEAENKPETLILVKDMIYTMNSIGTAVGLASNQVNSNLRVFVMKDGGKSICLINPVITKARGKRESGESCLSIPGISGIVPVRNENIDVEYYDESFKKKKVNLRGFSAIVAQHEIHHLDGILYTDLMTKEGQEAVSDKLSDIAKGIYVATAYKMIFPDL